jgi:hypothetical protein
MNEEKFDRLFDAALSQAAKNHNFSPESERSWLVVEKQVKRRIRSKSRLKMLPYVAASFILGALLFGSPAMTQAMSPFYQKVKVYGENIVRIIFESVDISSGTSPKTSPPPEYSPSVDGEDLPVGQNTEENHHDLSEAAKQLAFNAPMINYLPDGVNLKNVKTIRSINQDKATTGVLFFSGEQSINFTISFRVLAPGEKLSTNIHGEGVRFESIKINNIEAFLMLAEDGSSSIEYIEKQLFISIVGNLSKDEIIKVARNIN